MLPDKTIIIYFPENENIGNENILPMYIIVPVIVGILFVILVLVFIIVFVKRKKARDGTNDEEVKKNSCCIRLRC